MISSVITTRNEEATIGRLVRALVPYGEVVVIDEGSVDLTVRRARQEGAFVAAYCGGIGPCLEYGWSIALSADPERVVQIDAGGSHDPGQVGRLLSSDAELVIGSRFCPEGTHAGPWWRKSASWLYGELMARKTGCPVRDWTSGYRAFTPNLVDKLLVHDRYEASMHAWQAEVVAVAYDLGASIEEVPIDYRPSGSSMSWAVAREAIGVLT